MWRCWTVLIAIVAVGGCASRPPDIRPREPLIVSGENPAPYLNVSIAAFTNENLGKGGKNRIFAPIREAEADYLPVLLRNALNESGHWGAVRVLPAANPYAEVQVRASILKSNALGLKLHVDVNDSRGMVWLDKIYTVMAHPSDYTGDPGDDALGSIFNLIANDMYKARLGITRKDATNILRAAKLRFAASLSPQSFSSYLKKDAKGVVHIAELPARDDKMYARVTKIEGAEYKFEDVMNDQYSAFYQKLRVIYPVWQADSYELLKYNKYINAIGTKFDFKRDAGSWGATKDVYETFKEYKMNEDELRELASTFKSETKPGTLALEGHTIELQGPLEDQYRQWRKILARIYAAEAMAPQGTGSASNTGVQDHP